MVKLGFDAAISLIDGAVTNAKIADLAVTAGKIATDAVETAKIKDANVTYAKLAPVVQNMFMPIGAVMPWLKSITGVPALPAGWVECSGQTLSDAGSLLNGQVIPNLNNGYFLYGAATSGATKTENFSPSHTHTIPLTYNVGAPYHSGTVQVVEGNASIASAGTATSGATTSGTAWTGYAVVWIMRVK